MKKISLPYSKRRMVRAYDKKVYPREFRNGDLVLEKILPILGEDQSK
jgi:hypothetical protein